MRFIAAILAFTALATAEERTATLVNPTTTRGIQEMMTVLRTVDDIQKLSIDSGNTVLSLQGNPAQLDAAAWLIHQLDKPAGWQPSEQEQANPATREFKLPVTERNNVLRVYFLPATTTTRSTQETLTVLRTVLDVQKIFNYTALQALAFRGTPAGVDAAEWLVQALEARTASAPYPLADGVPADVVRVFPLPDDISPERMQLLVTELRTRPLFIMKVFMRTTPPAIAVRGTAAQLDEAEKVIPPIKVATR